MNDKDIKKYFYNKKNRLILSIVSLVSAITLFILKDINKFFILISFLLANATIMLFIKYSITSIKIKRFDKNYFKDVIFNDLRKGTTENYSKYKIIFTDEYLISLQDLRVVYYKDIIWAYPYTINYGGIVNLTVKTNNKKTYYVAESSGNPDNYYMINEFIKIIKKKNKSLLVGFNDENKKKYKKLINK